MKLNYIFNNPPGDNDNWMEERYKQQFEEGPKFMPERPQDRPNRNKETLDLFVQYCEQNPQFRFWQALTNFISDEFGKVYLIKKYVPGMYPAALMNGHEFFKRRMVDPYNWEHRLPDGDHPETIQPLLEGGLNVGNGNG